MEFSEQIKNSNSNKYSSEYKVSEKSEKYEKYKN